LGTVESQKRTLIQKGAKNLKRGGETRIPLRRQVYRKKGRGGQNTRRGGKPDTSFDNGGLSLATRVRFNRIISGTEQRGRTIPCDAHA